MSGFLKIEFLGTGTSTGVPVVGCSCEVCQSTDPKNKRLRSSLVVSSATTTLLIDSTPDLRQQLLRSKITHIDAILYSHIHLDHVAGFDDLRAFCWGERHKLPLYAGEQTLKGLQTMFSWAFLPTNTYKGYIRPDPHALTAPTQIGDILVEPFLVEHATVETLGYRFSLAEDPHSPKIAYMVDVKNVPSASKYLLKDLDLLIMDALREGTHPTHQGVEEALALTQELHPKNTLLTHSSHSLDYEKTIAKLPAHVSLAYDTQVLTLPAPLL